VHTGASIGITVHPADGGDAQTMLRNADMAMYQAKARGRNTFQFFTNEMSRRAEQFVTLEKDLRRSLGTSEFDFHYQPVLRLDDGTLAGAEALLRWQHPERGQVPPGEFIPVAEETRLIAELGAWGLRHACRTAREWCRLPHPALPRLAVNVSSRQFWGGFDGEFVHALLAETGFPPECLVFEMTESLLVDEDERVLAILKSFRDMGIGIAIDDFGTGYSALGYLRRFPVTMLKIDRSFVHDIENDAGDAHLTESIIAIGRALRIAVVAEGVETAGQAELLRQMGCDFVQGWLYGHPLPAAAFAARHLRATPRPQGVVMR
jgi:EAL domain-containing protein (putative c-di-GMP-specific phosphodiesterase class I)